MASFTIVDPNKLPTEDGPTAEQDQLLADDPHFLSTSTPAHINQNFETDLRDDLLSSDLESEPQNEDS